MRKQGVIVFGAGQHAQVVLELISALPDYEPLGVVIADNQAREISHVMGVSVLGTDSDFREIYIKYPDAQGVIALGDIGQRQQVLENVEALFPDFSWATLVHPGTTVSPSADLATGVVIMAGARVQALARIGPHAIINTGALVEHDAVISAMAHLAPGVVLGGDVHIGKRTLLGLGTIVRNGLRIGNDCVIGAGAVVVTDLPDNVLAYGQPARVMGKR